MIKGLGVLALCHSLFFILNATRTEAVTIADVTANVSTLNPQDKQNFLVKGAQ
jgi:hypothetical protein